MLQEPQPELQAGAVVVLVVSGLEPPLVESSDTCSVAGTLVGRARHTSVALRTTSGRRSTPEVPMHSGDFKDVVRAPTGAAAPGPRPATEAPVGVSLIKCTLSISNQ